MMTLFVQQAPQEPSVHCNTKKAGSNKVLFSTLYPFLVISLFLLSAIFIIMMQYFLLLVILVGGAALSIKKGKLTTTAGLTGGVLGLFIFMGAGFTGIAMTAAFFLLATFATSFHKKTKEQHGLSAINSSKRNAGQVFANAGVAALCGLLCYFFKKDFFIFSVMMAASLSSATADTVSSETGNVLGRKFYNILTFKKDIKGLDGVISLEGTIFGITGSIVMAAVYCIGFGFHFQTFFIIPAAGTIGNFADSVLGASLERKHYVNNDAVNFLNTLIAAITAWLLLSFSNLQVH